MTDRTYKHIVEFDEAAEKLVIHRLFSNGSTVSYTEISFDELTKRKHEGSLSSVCALLGEVIILDSPVGRICFDI